MINLERQLKTFANKRRLAIIKFLDARTEASVGDIAENIRLSFKATFKHLTILSSAEVVDKEQRSNLVYYRLVVPKSQLLKQILIIL
jgi:DNA-binding transcriptional ArsR family regulator